jgi:hypothetical protein
MSSNETIASLYDTNAKRTGDIHRVSFIVTGDEAIRVTDNCAYHDFTRMTLDEARADYRNWTKVHGLTKTDDHMTAIRNGLRPVVDGGRWTWN